MSNSQTRLVPGDLAAEIERDMKLVKKIKYEHKDAIQLLREEIERKPKVEKAILSSTQDEITESETETQDGEEDNVFDRMFPTRIPEKIKNNSNPTSKDKILEVNDSIDKVSFDSVNVNRISESKPKSPKSSSLIQSEFPSWYTTNPLTSIRKAVTDDNADLMWESRNEIGSSFTAPSQPYSQTNTNAAVSSSTTKRGISMFSKPEKSFEKKSKSKAIRKYQEEFEEDNDVEEDNVEIRPQFDDENIAMNQDAKSLETLEPLKLDQNYQVHSYANRYLREYQRDGIRFLFKNHKSGIGSVLNDDMGLGKTVQVISLISALLSKTGTAADKRKVDQRKRSRRNSSSMIGSGMAHTILIICPVSVLPQWKREFDTWGYFDVQDLSATDAEDRENLVLSCGKGNNPEILLGNYFLLSNDRNLVRALKEVTFELIILDEVHELKNPKAEKTKNVRSLRAKSKIGLTGTIMQNRLDEFWTVMTTVDEKALPAFSEFKKFYSNPILRARNKTASAEIIRTGQNRAKDLRKKMDKRLLRRTKLLIADQLPIKIENVVFCKLTDLQRRVYERIINGKDARLLKQSQEPCDCGRGGNPKKGSCCYKRDETAPLWAKQHPDEIQCARCPSCIQLPFITKLIMSCNHIDLLKYACDEPEKDKYWKKKFAEEAFGEDAKEIGFEKPTNRLEMYDNKLSVKLKVLGQLLDIWKTQPRTRVLIFSHYTRVLDIIHSFIELKAMKPLRLDGSTPSLKRLELVDTFNDMMQTERFIFLISTKAGGQGLNLTAANIVVIFDSSWNPAHDLQAQDRAYRLGQRRDVDVYRLISTGTIEDKIYCRQLYKMQLGSVALEGNSEERFFEDSELFGLANLISYNPEGYLSELKNQVEPSIRKPSKATALAARVGDRQGTFSVRTVGEIPKVDESELDNPTEDELPPASSVEDEEEKIAENLIALTKPSDRKKSTREVGLVESLDDFIKMSASNNEEEADLDDNRTLDSYSSLEEGGRTEDEVEDELNVTAEEKVIQASSHFTINARSLVKKNRQEEDEL